MMEVEGDYEVQVQPEEQPEEQPVEGQGQIRIRPLDQLCENYENEAEGEQQEADGKGNLPFGCALCSSKFKKKLFLNNHMEKRHGIKFVFTEKGKKVKLVRMPEELAEGEKLDPCVEALMQQNGQNSSNILGVQTVDQHRRSDDLTAAHEVDPCDLLQGRTEREFGAGILVKRIRTFAMKTAQDRKETPFVAYRPLLSKRLYLLNIQTLNDSTQLLLPATDADLTAADGVENEPSFYFTNLPFNPTQTSTPLAPSRQVIKKTCTRFSHVAIVALVEQTMGEEYKLQMKLQPPPSPGPISLIKSPHFSRTIIQSRPKRLRCLSLPPKPMPRPVVEKEPRTPRQKRKYTRRNPFTKRARREETKKRRRRPASSEEESDMEGGSETSGSDYEDVVPRMTRVRSHESPLYLPRRERADTPTRKPHPFHDDDLEPPKRKYIRRGRKPKSSPDDLGNRLKKMKLEPNAENRKDDDDTPAQTRKPKVRKRVLGEDNAKDSGAEEKDPLAPSEDEGDRESERSKVIEATPFKKRGRGRPRKTPHPE